MTDEAQTLYSSYISSNDNSIISNNSGRKQVLRSNVPVNTPDPSLRDTSSETRSGPQQTWNVIEIMEVIRKWKSSITN